MLKVILSSHMRLLIQILPFLLDPSLFCFKTIITKICIVLSFSAGAALAATLVGWLATGATLTLFRPCAKFVLTFMAILSLINCVLHLCMVGFKSYYYSYVIYCHCWFLSV